MLRTKSVNLAYPLFGVEKDLCKGCGYCIEICSHQVLYMSDNTNDCGFHAPEMLRGELCGMCKKCELICPEMAITIKS